MGNVTRVNPAVPLLGMAQKKNTQTVTLPHSTPQLTQLSCAQFGAGLIDPGREARTATAQCYAIPLAFRCQPPPSPNLYLLRVCSAWYLGSA